MANRHRGEVTLKAGGRSFTLCLTLGALAELEDVYGGTDILALAERFSSGRLGTADALNLLRAGLLGGGNEVDGLNLSSLSFDGGMAGLIRTLAELLQVTFGAPAGDPALAEESGEGDARPFPGSRS